MVGLASVSLVVALPADLDAGSVIMKNGYIIQGPIVERSDVSIILGWPNGKVTIHHRFIDTVSYDPGEEKRLQEDELYRAQEKSPAPEDLSLLSSAVEVEDLPANVEDLMKRYESIARKGLPGQTGDAASGAGGETGLLPTDGSQATLITRPDTMLAERMKDDNVSVSFMPPRGWSPKSKKDFLHVAGTATPDGFKPSMNVVVVPRGGLNADDYVSLLKEEDARILDGFELLSEGPRQVGSLKGYEVVGRGTYQGREAILRQVVVVKGERVWLLSAFTEDQSSQSAFSVVDESLKTFEFVER
jgi:hypothetical protein